PVAVVARAPGAAAQPLAHHLPDVGPAGDLPGGLDELLCPAAHVRTPLVLPSTGGPAGPSLSQQPTAPSGLRFRPIRNPSTLPPSRPTPNPLPLSRSGHACRAGARLARRRTDVPPVSTFVGVSSPPIRAPGGGETCGRRARPRRCFGTVVRYELRRPAQ